MSSLYQQLTQGSGSPNGYCLYGDNAYVNESYMSVPYPNTSSGPREPTTTISHKYELTLNAHLEF